jgi:ArsR family transcriptional regulator
MSSLPLPLAQPPDVDALEALFRGFADPVRIRILNLLTTGPLCVSELVETLELPQSTVSRHLGHLLRAGLVEVSREWKYARYRLAAANHPVHQSLVNCLHGCFTGIPSLDADRRRAEARFDRDS